MTVAADSASRRAPQRRSRRRILLVVLLALLAAALGLLRWASRPQQVASLVMAQTGRALGLQVTAAGVSEYRLRGGPQIVLRDVVALREGDPTPVLRSRRILLSVPWTTLRSRGRDLVIHRIELDRPELDLRALQRWLASRPKTGPTRAPRLTHGFVVRAGTLRAEGWHLAAVDLDVPLLAPDRPVRGRATGRLVAGTTRIPFGVNVTLSRPRRRAGLGVAGHVSVERPDWRMPLRVRLSGTPSLEREIVLEGMRLGAHGRFLRDDVELPLAFGVAGRAEYRSGLALDPVGFSLRQGRELPDLDGVGSLRWARDLALRLEGRLLHWPSRWPALPAPLGRPRGALPLELDYAGPLDLSGGTGLVLRDGKTVFDGRFRLPLLLQWLDAPPGSTPIPPLDGRIRTPRLEIPGALLEGVEVEVDP